MFYVPAVGIYTHLSTPIPIFINRIQHFWGYYEAEAGSQRLLCVPGVGLPYLFQLPTPNLSCGPKNQNPKGLNRGFGTPSYWNQSESASHKRRYSSTKVQRDGRTPSGKRSS
jgi:hypothetical protein